jgi:cytochrome c
VKKLLLPFAVIAMLVACNSSSDNATSTTDSSSTSATNTDTSTATPAATDITQDPNYSAGLAIEAKSDCATCHKINEKLVGPAFKEIATKYAGADDTKIDSLASKVINGGAGNWGQVPMTPHPALSKEDARTVVKYVLLLKDAQ